MTVADEHQRRSARGSRQIQRAEAGSARLARADGGGRRGDAHQRRRARARDRRHRRHLPAQDRQPAGAVRRHPGLSQGPPHPRQPPHLDPPHQHDDGHAGRRHRDRAGAPLAQVHEGGAGPSRRSRWRVRRAAGERQDRRRHRPVQDSGAALARARRRLLHRHRRHGDHARSRHRLDQLRRLSRAGARQERSPP